MEICLDVVIPVTFHGDTEQPEPWAVPCRAKATPDTIILREGSSNSGQFMCFGECQGGLFYTVTDAV